MFFYYVVIECASCEEEIYSKCATTIEHDGLPVVPYDVGATGSFVCGACGEVTVTDELEPIDRRDV